MFLVCAISFLTIAVSSEAFRYYGAFNIKTFVMNIFMFQDYPLFLLADKILGGKFAVTSFSSARPFWTLAIEWWYYMFFGYFWLHLKDQVQIHLLDVLVLGVLSVVPIFNLLTGRGNCLTLIWLGGVVIENLYGSINIKSRFLLKLILILLAALLIADGIFIREAYSRSFQVLTLLTLWAFFVFLKNSDNMITGEKFQNAVKFMASYSYSLYLIHYSILDFIYSIPNCNISDGMKVFIGVALSNILACGFAYIFERKTSLLVKKCSDVFHA